MIRRALSLVAIAAIAVAFTFAIANSFPTPAAKGLPDAGIGIEWIVGLLKAATDLIAGLTLGLLIYLTFVAPDENGVMTHKSQRRLVWVIRGAQAWFVLAVVRVVVGLAEELGISVSDALNTTYLRSYLTQTSIGRYLIAQLVFLGIALMVLFGAQRWVRLFFGVIVMALAAIMPAMTGHSAGSGNHSLALGSIAIHIWAIAAWLGVVVGLWLDRGNHEVVAKRASSVAFGAALAVAASGIANGWVRLSTINDLASGYGRVLIAKTLFFMILISFGARMRARGLAIGAMARVITTELMIMSFTIGVGAALSRLEPPIPREVTAQTPAEALTGSVMLPAPTLGRVVSAFSLDGFSLTVLILMTLAYLAGVRALRRRGDDWPANRIIFFLAGIVILFIATNGGLAAYAKLAFSWHMVAHMVVVSVAPIAIILGAPITLALRTLPSSRDGVERGLRGHLQAALNSRTVALLSHPIWAVIVFDASLFGLYFTDAFASLMRWHLGHTLMDLHFLAVGLLFFYVIVGIDPNPRRTPHLVRVVLLLVAMSVHAFFSIALMSTNSLIDGGYFAELQRPWNSDLIADQQMGGSLGWGLGEVPIVLALIATFIQWVRADNREARRIDRAADRADALGEEDELAAYNAYLQRLAERDREES